MRIVRIVFKIYNLYSYLKNIVYIFCFIIEYYAFVLSTSDHTLVTIFYAHWYLHFLQIRIAINIFTVNFLFKRTSEKNRYNNWTHCNKIYFLCAFTYNNMIFFCQYYFTRVYANVSVSTYIYIYLNVCTRFVCSRSTRICC